MGRRLLLALTVAALLVALLLGTMLLGGGRGSTAARATRPATDPTTGPGESIALQAPTEEGSEATGEPSGAELTSSARVRMVGSALLRGRVVDARTGQGLPRIEVRMSVAPAASEPTTSATPAAGPTPMRTDDEGYFASALAVPFGQVSLAARDLLTGKELGTAEHEHVPAGDSPRATQLTWPVEVGPTFVVDLVGGEAGEEPWRLGLVEQTLAGDQLHWGWALAQHDPRGRKLRARFPTVQHEPSTERRVALEARDASQRYGGEAPLSSAPGVHVLELRVAPVAATLSGRVLDEDGAPVSASVFTFSRGSEETAESDWPRPARTEDGGSYRIDGLSPGNVHVLVASDHRELLGVDLLIAPGEQREQDFTLESLRIAGDVRGEMVGPTGSGEPIGVVLLSSLDRPAADLLEVCFDLHIFDESEADERSPFAFEGLPEGRYRLEVIPLDGRTYAPSSQVIEPPASGVDFVSEEPLTWELDRELILRAHDRRSAAPLEEFSWLARIGPFWGDHVRQVRRGKGKWNVPNEVPVSILFAAPGHRPVWVASPEGELDDGAEVLDVALEPGWGAAVLVFDVGRLMGGRQAFFDDILAMPPLVGARVWAGGRVVGTSDATGLALCASDGPIEHLEVTLPGWRVVSVQRFQGHRRTPDGIGFVLMVRD